MKTLKTKVILSAVVLLFALVATIGSTFAWFTVATSVEVDEMTLNVSTTDSLLIRVFQGEAGDNATLLNASTYKTFIPIEDITGTGSLYENLDTWRLTPVTVVNPGYTGLIGSGFNVLTTPNTDYLRALSAPVLQEGVTLANHAQGYVIELKFWVLSQGSNPNSHLVLEDLVIENKGPETQDGVVNAVRLAAQATAGSRYIFGLTNDYGFTYIPSLPGHFSGSVYTGTTLNGFNSINQMTLGRLGAGLPIIPGSDPEVPYATLTDQINADVLNGLFLGDSPVDNATVTSAIDATRITTLAQNVPTLVTVTIFVEGWAADTINNIIAANFDISFKFSLYLAPLV